MLKNIIKRCLKPSQMDCRRFMSILHLSKPKLSKQFLCRQALPSNICSMGKHVNALDGIAGGLFALELLTRDCSLLSTLKGLG